MSFGSDQNDELLDFVKESKEFLDQNLVKSINFTENQIGI